MKNKVVISRMDPRFNQLLFGKAPGGHKDPGLCIHWSLQVTYTPKILRDRCCMTDEQILELFPELAD